MHYGPIIFTELGYAHVRLGRMLLNVTFGTCNSSWNLCIVNKSPIADGPHIRKCRHIVFESVYQSIINLNIIIYII